MESHRIESFRRDVRRIEREIDRQLKNSRICCGVSLAQCHMLMELGLHAPMTISGLAEIMKLDKSTLSRTIESMVRAGLVERTISPQDRRCMDVALTGEGKRIFHSINGSCNGIYAGILKRIPEHKHGVVFEGMTLLADAMRGI